MTKHQYRFTHVLSSDSVNQLLHIHTASVSSTTYNEDKTAQ